MIVQTLDHQEGLIFVFSDKEHQELSLASKKPANCWSFSLDVGG